MTSFKNWHISGRIINHARLFPDGISHPKINFNLNAFHLTTDKPCQAYLFHYLAGPCRYLVLWLTPHHHDYKLKNSRYILSIWFLVMVVGYDSGNTESSTMRKHVIAKTKVIWILCHYFIWAACEYQWVLVAMPWRALFLL